MDNHHHSSKFSDLGSTLWVVSLANYVFTRIKPHSSPNFRFSDIVISDVLITGNLDQVRPVCYQEGRNAIGVGICLTRRNLEAFQGRLGVDPLFSL